MPARDPARRARFLVSQTSSVPERLDWPPEVEVVNERRWVDRFAARFPARWEALGYNLGQALFGAWMLWRARRYDAVSVGRYGNFYIAMAAMLGLRRATVLTDVERRYVGRSRVDRRVARAATRIGCFTRAEMASFAGQYGVSLDKFRFLPYCTQAQDLREQASDGGYVFSAGRNARDWPTLLQAVGGLPYPVHILTQKKFESLPGNCTARLATHAEYFDELAHCSCVAVALEPEPLRVTGMITFVTALAMGKPVVLAGPQAGSDYILQGQTGFCLDYGDAAGMRASIELLMGDAELRARMGRAAREHARREFSLAAHQARILDLLREAAAAV